MKKGFTLIELMIVIAILAILIAIAVPAIQKHNNPRAFAAQQERMHQVEAERDSMDGMTIFTDPQTGCQYLNMPGRSMTPRMGQNGKQICTNTSSF